MLLHGQFLYLWGERDCCAVTTRSEQLPVYYCYSCSSPEQSPVARKILVFNKHARKTGAAARCFCRFKKTARRVGSVCLNFASRGCSSRGFGADGAAFVASVLSLHEQRTGWSSRLGTERRWRSRRAVYNNNTIAVTSRDWQRARPVAEPRRHQQHAIFGKWLHHRGARAAGGGRDFRLGFSICSPETGQWVQSACLRSFKSGFFFSSFCLRVNHPFTLSEQPTSC